ncbi:MAG: DoxX family membrane protein [Opitutales bacterium]|nr:DoxX family membrane protein [Opitutales bacterium]
MNNLLDRQLAFLILRLALGLNMLMRALIRLPDAHGFATGMARGFEETILPTALVIPLAYAILLAELLIGILLILGWKTRAALFSMGILMLILAFGMLLRTEFGTVANILVYTLAVVLALFFREFNRWCLDKE